MEISKTDLGFFEWGCLGSDIAHADATAVGSGIANSAAIAGFHDRLADYYTNPSICNAANDGTVVAQRALAFHAFNYQNADDWFLPSQEELLLAYQNLNVIFLGDFYQAPYWTSTESDADHAIVVDFFDGSVNAISKIPPPIAISARAIRYF
ncbi:hypothetical protein [Flavobacterium sp. 3HN19-14]|uniref:hypothetical protein n=1 Tax=Flavobacterium sp. 3HN19-14 TaxID=3448133 RepID=UPI003EE03B4C